MKKLLVLILAVVMSVATCMSFTACGKSKLIVYTEAGFAPWEFTKDGSTEIIGVDVEIANYIANKYNYELQIVNGTFDSIIAGINEDNALGIAGISWTQERAKNIEYSDFYYGGTFQTVVYLKSTQGISINQDGQFAKSNFSGKSVVYQTGTTSQMTISENQTEWGITGCTDYTLVQTALDQVNDTKYLIIDSDVAKALCNSNANYTYATIEGVDAESYGVVAKKGNTELINKVNEAIKELLVKDANGKTQIDKWYEQYSAMSPAD